MFARWPVLFVRPGLIDSAALSVGATGWLAARGARTKAKAKAAARSGMVRFMSARKASPVPRGGAVPPAWSRPAPDFGWQVPGVLTDPAPSCRLQEVATDRR